MKFQVPQFIEIEDKIFGPFSFRQFAYLVGGVGGSYVLYQLLPLYIAIFIILPLLGLALALTFFKMNGKPFIYILEAWWNYLFISKLYIWKKRPAHKKKEVVETEAEILEPDLIPTLGASKLSDISWNLDVNGSNVKKKNNPLETIKMPQEKSGNGV